MTHRLAFCAACLALSFCGACSNGGDRYVMDSSNQGNFAVKKQDNPMDSIPKPARDAEPQTGPSQREIELQKRIDEIKT